VTTEMAGRGRHVSRPASSVVFERNSGEIATIRLLDVACPDLSGGTFSVSADFIEVAANTLAIREKDLRVMGLRGKILEERDG